MPTHRTTGRPNNPNSACGYCRSSSIGTSDAEQVVCDCATNCGARRCESVAGATTPATQTTDRTADPFGPPLPDLEQDRVQRWNPDPHAVRLARVLLAAEPDADIAVIPMYQPGKTYGVWRSGQTVHTVHGAVLLSRNSFDTAGRIPSHPWARDMAARIAADRLRRHAADHPGIRNDDGGIGTVAWANVSLDSDRAGVFEDAILPEEHT